MMRLGTSSVLVATTAWENIRAHQMPFSGDAGDKVGDAAGKRGSVLCINAGTASIDLAKSRETANPAGALSFQLKDGI